MRTSSLFAAFLAGFALAGTAQATRLTFVGLPDGRLGPTANTSYGDRVVSAGTGVTLDGGATPNVVLDFVPLSSTQSSFEVYSSGYSGLLHALGDGSFNVPGYVQLTPDTGWDVVLESFQVGAWSSGSYTGSRIRVEDLQTNVLFDTGSFTFPGNTVFSYPDTPIRSSVALRVYINEFGDLGLDNLQFSQVATIPEPSTWALWLAGAGLLGARVLRRKR
jgi:hypothetical protein